MYSADKCVVVLHSQNQYRKREDVFAFWDIKYENYEQNIKQAMELLS